MKNYYQILGLEEGSNLDEIKAAYRKYVIKFHPDKHNGDNFFKERFQEVQEAYDYLCTHYTEPDEFICDDEKEDSTVPPIQSLNSTDIELTCTKSEIYEGETITFSWHTAIPCQATISIDNGYKTQEYNNIDNSGSKSIAIKRIKGKYITIILWCYNENSKVSKSIRINKKEDILVDENIKRQIQEDDLIKKELDNSVIWQILNLLSFITFWGYPITLIICCYASDEFQNFSLLEHIGLICGCICLGIFMWLFTFGFLSYYFKEHIIKKMRDMGKFDEK